jgi:hypothetical protein
VSLSSASGPGGNPPVDGLGGQGDIEGRSDVFEKDSVGLPAGLLEEADLRFDAALPEGFDPSRRRGLGSTAPTTTRPGRCAIRASVHGESAVMAARLQRDMKVDPATVSVASRNQR